MTERVRGAAWSGGLAGYPHPGAAFAMAALGALATVLSLLSADWWLVLGGLATTAVGVRWWWQARTLPSAAAVSSVTEDSRSDVPDGHR